MVALQVAVPYATHSTALTALTAMLVAALVPFTLALIDEV